MNDPRLLTLLTLVKVKNYTKTAQQLFITQPAVTHHIKSIEKEFDIRLFANPKTFELTPEGSIMVEYARRMVNQSTQLSSAIEKSKQTTKKLFIAITDSASCLLKNVDLLNVFFSYFNNFCQIETNTLDHIFRDIQQGNIDFAIIDSDYDDDIFEGILLDQFSIIPVCFQEGKFKEIKRVTREMIKNNTVILGTNKEGLLPATMKALKNANIHINASDVVVSNSYLLIDKMIEAKDGIGFIYENALDGFPQLKKMELRNFSASQSIYLIYNQNSFEKKTIREITGALKKWSNQK